MATIVIQLDPALLANPDADILCKLPDLLAHQLANRVSSDGYDYVGKRNLLHLFLGTDNAERDLPGIIEVLKSERLLGNDLSHAPIVFEDSDALRVVCPPGFTGVFKQSGGE